MLPVGSTILEIGAGKGWQARGFQERGYDISAIDLASNAKRVWPVKFYDGAHIPYADESFDVVFTSCVLEHIPHVHAFQGEIHRVLRPNGIAVHVLPSSTWRIWTNVTHLLKWWILPTAHGEPGGNALTEIWYFSRWWWCRLFRETGWTVLTRTPNRLCYTGHSIMDTHLSLRVRHFLSRALGSSCNIFVVRKLECAS